MSFKTLYYFGTTLKKSYSFSLLCICIKIFIHHILHLLVTCLYLFMTHIWVNLFISGNQNNVWQIWNPLLTSNIRQGTGLILETVQVKLTRIWEGHIRWYLWWFHLINLSWPWSQIKYWAYVGVHRAKSEKGERLNIWKWLWEKSQWALINFS